MNEPHQEHAKHVEKVILTKADVEANVKADKEFAKQSLNRDQAKEQSHR